MNKYTAYLLVFAACVACDTPGHRPPGSVPAEAVVATSEDVDEDLAARLEAAMLAKKSYRTRHLRSDGKPKFTNRLVLEASPYLQQHAHNPVDWYPWGDEAFETAKRLGRPVLLSIGYSTCHWCHVMEEESFEDLEVAKVLNDNYIAIKVDREERPDVDSTYMAAVQRIAGRGGWPMTMWLTPERTPFFGGTYFPPRAGVRGSRKGFTELLQEWSGRYRDDPQGTVQAAQELASEVARGADVDRSGKIGNRTRALDLAVRAFQRSYDAQNHGWGRQKFPMPSRLRFLLRAATYEEDTGALKMVTQTLDAMAHGGIFDHVAGGFHRYTVDPNWRTPHFEKMLYDNAALITTYTEAWQLTKSPLYAEVVRRCVEYLLREMRNGAGAFYAATDADSEGEEGTYFVWTPAQVDEAAPRHAKLLKLYFGIVKNGPFEGSNVLHVAVPAAQAAKQLGLSLPQFKQELEEGVAALLKVRQTRVPPHRDDKILTAWNGLMIEALAKAGFAFSRPEWVAAGEAAAAGLPVVEGKLRRSATNGQPGPKAFAVDHAFVVAGLLALFEASGNPAHLRRAIVVQKQQDASFWDAKRGGYYLNSAEAASELLVRERPFRDGAIASPNSVSLLNLAKLSALLDDAKLLERRDALEHAFGRSLQNQGASAPQMLVGVDWLAGDPKEVAIVGDDAEALLKVLRTGFYPHHVLARPTSASVVPWLEGKVAREGRATAYVCRNYACKLPTTDAAVFSKQLRAP